MDEVSEFVVLSLAVWRVCRVIVAEDGPFDVFATLRERSGILKQCTWIARGLMCVACISFWLGLIVAVLRFGLSIESVAYGLALSAVSVILLRRVG